MSHSHTLLNLYFLQNFYGWALPLSRNGCPDFPLQSSSLWLFNCFLEFQHCLQECWYLQLLLYLADHVHSLSSFALSLKSPQMVTILSPVLPSNPDLLLVLLKLLGLMCFLSLASTMSLACSMYSACKPSPSLLHVVIPESTAAVTF